MTAFPPPGSHDAQRMGCACPAIDNHHGRGYREQPGQFVIADICPLHGRRRARPDLGDIIRDDSTACPGYETIYVDP